MKPGFHHSSATGAVQAGKARWVTRQVPERRVSWEFETHYHPYVDELIQTLNREGLEALLDVRTLEALHQDLLGSELYTPAQSARASFPRHEIDVSDDGAYANYNWELFFHAPLTVAVHLSKNQRFAEAQRWFHFIFDPTSTDTSVDAPARFWRFLRFRRETKPEFIDELLAALAATGSNPLKERMQTAITQWRDKPFRPHVVARSRYLAYQLSVVMKYLDNLLAWGDSLFRQDTAETTAEATQIYVLAANILGERPQRVPARRRTRPRTYAQLRAAGIDDFGNALVEMENVFPFDTATPPPSPSASGTGAALGIGRSLYFCIPPNDVLLSYWDRVGDRLFKLRNCLNIDGVFRQLALFDPPIDPGALVRAAAAGLDIASIVNNVNQPVSTVRGPLLLQKAIELCSEVKALGSALLLALEKADGEHLALLRQQHERKSLSLATDVRFLQWKEAEAATEALLKSRAVVFERYRHYKRILGASDADLERLARVELTRSPLTAETFDDLWAQWVGRYAQPIAREAYRKETSVGGLMEFAGNAVVSVVGGKLGETLPLNKNEDAELNIFLPSSDFFGAIKAALSLAAPLLGLIPQFNAKAQPLGVGVGVGFGGEQLSEAAKGGARIAGDVSDAFRSSADRASKMAGYYRRAEDYVLQANVAASELEQYGRQVLSALLKEQILAREYQNHLAQVENAEEMEEFVREKFTNEELYTWMQGQISQTYYDCYKFAFDLARRAEQTLKHELMRPELDAANYIRFGYWDAGRRGLLAGDALSFDLKRLEMAYHEHNRREYEMTRHVSLARLDPVALLRLKATGACDLSIPEWLFDLDSPGQYMRRIKTVAVSIPCVTGPYTGVHCRVSLRSSSIRVSPLLGEGYARTGTEDARFRDFRGAIQSMVTSTGQNDSGMFEVNLGDARYLPFEGAGAVSDWRLELPGDLPQFDRETISDVVLHVRYTAREAGHLEAPAAEWVRDVVSDASTELLQLFSLNYDFGAEWHRFGAAGTDAERILSLSVDTTRFPYWAVAAGLGAAVSATFATIDPSRGRLTVAPVTVALTGDAATGWRLSIDMNSPVFAFLRQNRAGRVHMALSYVAS